MKQRKTVEDYLKAVYLLQKQNGSRTWCGYCSRSFSVASHSFRFAERVGKKKAIFS